MIRRLALLIACWLGVGCGMARLVERAPNGSVVALRGFRDLAMNDARHQMDNQCGAGNYTIVREWEQPTGSVSSTSQNVSLSDDGTGTLRGSGTGQADTQQTTEWRVAFQCGPRPGGRSSPAGPVGEAEPTPRVPASVPVAGSSARPCTTPGSRP